MTFEEIEIQVSNLIAKDEVEAAITLLSRFFHGNEKLQAIVLQSGRFHSLRKDQMNGVIDYTTVQQQLNQLRAGILDFVRSQKSNPLWENIQEVTAPEVEVNYPELYRVSLTRVAVTLALREAPEGLSITRIHQVSGGQRRKYIVLVLKEMEAGGLIEKHKMSRATYWKLSEQGGKLAAELGRSLRLNSGEA